VNKKKRGEKIDFVIGKNQLSLAAKGWVQVPKVGGRGRKEELVHHLPALTKEKKAFMFDRRVLSIRKMLLEKKKRGGNQNCRPVSS